MKKLKYQKVVDFGELPSHIAEIPERQRKAMQKARQEGSFNAKAHLESSPIGRAMVKGFPIPIR